MAAERTFESTEVWKDTRFLIKEVFRITGTDRMKHEYFLRDQMRRSAISTLSNIAEGFERDGNKELIQFLSQAKGSAGELLAQFTIGYDLGLISPDDFRHLHDMVTGISRQLSGFIRYLSNSGMKGRKFSGRGKNTE